ncbi:MAG: TIGR04283 family arsenosugar biosynthesis glycosyltransferase [Deltaproteobacteria bacterium]|nr:TIGR04283 family arsenosugar biosynthesis glycosyltransferase [Deltaproteobacteria bacterium]MBI3390217.1 TIGR04283 family arsenosugar biosynthesis glycosyltransferase [Deltaproteobacteria bacterium]
MDISIVVPTLNEEATLAATLAHARAPAVREIIVVDGGSTDATGVVAAAAADRVLNAPRGRAAQMNAGAAVAAGEVLLFLHADTLLPAGFDAAVVAALANDAVVGGRFDVALMPSTPLLRIVGALINLRSRLSRIATGDQAIFVRRCVFEELGGFPLIPLMEDLAFSRTLKRCGRVACIRLKVVTSSRRWVRGGVIRTIVLMWWLRLLYFCGVSPARLRRIYADTR